MGDYTIYTYTIVRVATPEFAGRVPYCAAILEGPDGTRFAALAEGYHEGMAVEVGQRVYALPGGGARYTLLPEKEG